VREIRLDCDGDVVLYAVEQAGGIACHTGRESCFFSPPGDGQMGRRRSGAQGPRTHLPQMNDAILRLAAVIESRRGGDPEVSYVARLLALGEDAILKKIGEEATETVMAAKDAGRGGARSGSSPRPPTSGSTAW
jgi:phosphoribosyl-ATP pyrophosphohydrolase/phosphoribosyl-AMP cyclohydrolase